MATLARKLHRCQRCSGVGYGTFYDQYGNQVYENPCSLCGGDGRANTDDYIDISDIMDKLDDVLDKINDVLEAVS